MGDSKVIKQESSSTRFYGMISGAPVTILESNQYDFCIPMTWFVRASDLGVSSPMQQSKDIETGWELDGGRGDAAYSNQGQEEGELSSDLSGGIEVGVHSLVHWALGRVDCTPVLLQEGTVPCITQPRLVAQRTSNSLAKLLSAAAE
ncbi:hypothetical protein UY3_07908 [Chelonia mydas]|uniref:Uncharacterized protein n=1 Tax=Chelonia mydas TaxID=8469 RepID=M7BCI5_CHEMY|nr:hypothetical protein UY3_07908 [Chelonia mydas]